MILDISIPSSWAKLSQKQLRMVFSFLSSDQLTMTQCKLLVAFRLAGIRFYGIHDSGALVRFNGIFYVLDDEDILNFVHAVDFIEDDPDFPVRIFEIKHRKAVHPLLRELSFAQWLAIENLYFGFIATKDISHINEILSILYPKSGIFSPVVKSFKSRNLDFTHINALKWLAAFKNYLSRRYPEIYRNLSSESSDSAPALSKQSVVESMNAQIRALTKGDITKKEAVLNMDVHSALTELDALALEARKINESFKKK